MPQRENDIAAAVSVWSDKASKLRAAAAARNICADSLVSFDDNPVERKLVRRQDPRVPVPRLPIGPTLHPDALLAASYFEATAFAELGRQCAYQYRTGGGEVPWRLDLADHVKPDLPMQIELHNASALSF